MTTSFISFLTFIFGSKNIILNISTFRVWIINPEILRYIIIIQIRNIFTFAKKHFFTFTKDKQKHILHSELGLSDEDVSDFVNKLNINIYADSYETQEKKVKENLCGFLGCRKQEVDLYYCNALNIVKQLSTEKDIRKRIISRKIFYAKCKILRK